MASFGIVGAMRESERLIVDRSAPASLTDEAFRAWCADQRVFVSSVMAEFVDARQTLASRIAALGAEPVWFEGFGGRDADREDAYLGEVRSSTIYVGILGRRYGRLLSNRFSATHAEYLAAEIRGLRFCVWATRDEDREGHLQSFLDEVQQFHTVGRFRSPNELADQVEARLRRIAAEDLSPWTKLDGVILRAERVVDHRDRIEISGRIRDADVLAELEALARPQLGWGMETEVVVEDAVRRVRVESMGVTRRASAIVEVVLDLRATGDTAGPGLGDISYSSGGRTYLPDELTELALRSRIFGEPNPLDDGFPLPDLPDVVGALRGLALPEESVRPVSRLLLSQALVGSGRAKRVTRFALGPPVRGRRRLILAWEPVSRYGDRPAVREIDGTLELS
jgi:hypothetical protein